MDGLIDSWIDGWMCDLWQSRSVTATERSGPGMTVENDVERRQVTGRQDVDHDYVRRTQLLPRYLLIT